MDVKDQAFISPSLFITVFRHYMEYRENVTHGLWRPHLIIYLDAPSEWILEEMMKKHVSCTIYSDTKMATV